MKSTNQIDVNGNIVTASDEILSPSEIQEKILDVFVGSTLKERTVHFTNESKKYAIYCKNISYLGHPHPLYKKRIQIGDNFKLFYRKMIHNNLIPLLLGIYTYDSKTMFCHFNVDDYIGKKSNNSSAHISIFDLQKCHQFGSFFKIDKNNNHMFLFSENTIHEYLNFLRDDYETDETKTLIIFKDFFSKLPTKWDGIEAYNQMFSEDFDQKRQAEWTGFYFEFLLSKFLLRNKSFTEYVQYRKQKKRDEIDLDLYFPKLKIAGDLKAHTSGSDVIGNDYASILKAIKQYGRIWYVVCEHLTNRDKDYDFQVTKHWNNLLLKEDSFSYCNKMKNSIKVESYFVLEITEDKLIYLSEFNQGINSNGNSREKKMMIKRKNLEQLVIYKFDVFSETD